MRYSIDTPFDGELEQLRSDFNSSVAGLRETLGEISNASTLIQNNGRQMTEAADDLAKRTEQQAASLEETAAAVDQITATVKTASSRAEETQRAVATAKRNADNSAAIVQNAISAMQRIKGASEKISQIIDVIDGIAFQTNLLALNAGVEAARAGDAGKGFAVVAQEVRELAQRSASAAKDIKQLVGASSEHVKSGVELVDKTGAALRAIAGDVSDISSHIADIVARSREQASDLNHIGSAISDIDNNTQQTAAMVEESAAAISSVASEAQLLEELIRRFKVGRDGKQPATARRAA